MQLHTIVNDRLSRRRPLIARDGIAHRLPGVVDAQPGDEPGPPLDSCASVVAVRCHCVAKLAGHDVQGVGHPCMCWMPIVARPGSRRITPRRSGPLSSPGPCGPSLVCGLLVFVVLPCVCPSWLSPPEDRTVASYPCSPEQTGRRSHNPAWAAQTSIRVPHKAPLATGDPCRVNDRATFGCSRHTVTARAARCEGSVMSLGQCMCRNCSSSSM